jgi:hypothetical protein
MRSILEFAAQACRADGRPADSLTQRTGQTPEATGLKTGGRTDRHLSLIRSISGLVARLVYSGRGQATD